MSLKNLIKEIEKVLLQKELDECSSNSTHLPTIVINESSDSYKQY